MGVRVRVAGCPSARRAAALTCLGGKALKWRAGLRSCAIW